MERKLNYQLFVKAMQLIHSITKIDLRLYDQNGRIIYQFVNYPLPALIHSSNRDTVKRIQHVLKNNERDHYYRYIDPYRLEYISAGLWEKDNFCGSIVIGPIISNAQVVDFMKDVMITNQLPASERSALTQFYESLPSLSDEEVRHIGELLVHARIHPYIHYPQIEAEEPLPPANIYAPKVEEEENKKKIEKRYELQNKLMDAITQGDQKKAKTSVQELMNDLVEFSNRVPGSPIRSSKNIGFVFNAMCRLAAERSGVHPLFLHQLSERFAILIERTTTIPQLKKLFSSMAIEYCDLVNTFSTGQYSPLAKKAIDYILLNIGSPLTLQLIARHIHANPSHLSRKFKEETGMTVTEYINRKRIEEAKLFLQRGNVSVTDVAFMVGFNDLNYFSKVFKKYTSLTPTEYMKKKHENIKHKTRK